MIIGAGPAGLACGYELSKAGAHVEIFESATSVGGMSGTIELWGQRVDFGPHRFFSKEPRINRFFKEQVGEDFTVVQRLTRIYYDKKFFLYPLNFFDVLRNLHPITIIKILLHYFYQKIRPIKDQETLEGWLVDRFGRKLFEIFFKNYSEKLWGMPCSHIDADWAAQRIKKLSLFEAIINTLKLHKGGRHATLVDKFAYPRLGTGMIYDRAAQAIEKNGGKVHLNTRVKRVVMDQGKVKGVELENGELVNAAHVVSTMPINLLVKGLPDVPGMILEAAGKLYFRNAILVYVEVNGLDLFDDNWIYVHSPEVKHGRITNFRNWSPDLNGDKQTSILCLEYWTFENEAIWSEEDKKLGQLAINELRQIELIPETIEILNTQVIRIPKCYPVYKKGYRKHLRIIEDYLRGIPGLVPVGRYGAFKYNNQDHSILMGILAAHNIVSDDNIDLWEINTDIEYQEDGKLKDALT